MIAALPQLYPDEILYSFCSRYHEWMGYRSREATGLDLFGKSTVKVAIDFPAHLQVLVQASHWGDWRTIDELIDRHTLLPFHTPFVSLQKLTQTRTAMAGPRGGDIHGRLGTLAHSVKLKNFRCCAKCIESDRSMFGETYWHRIHQLPGINICPIHKIFLSETNLHARIRYSRQAFVTAEAASINLVTTEMDPTNPDHIAYMKLAEDAKWLLETPLPGGTNDGNRERYLTVLYERGLSGYYGRVRLNLLIEHLRNHYSDQLMAHFQYPLRDKPNWLTRFIQSMDKSHHPIEHLLLLHSLKLTAADFFHDLPVRLPFGKGPWPCLNPTCNKFQISAISDYEKRQTPMNQFSKKQRKWVIPLASSLASAGLYITGLVPIKTRQTVTMLQASLQ